MIFRFRMRLVAVKLLLIFFISIVLVFFIFRLGLFVEVDNILLGIVELMVMNMTAFQEYIGENLEFAQANQYFPDVQRFFNFVGASIVQFHELLGIAAFAHAARENAVEVRGDRLAETKFNQLGVHNVLHRVVVLDGGR